MKTIPDGRVQCIIADIPYESMEKHRAKGTTTRLKESKASSNEWYDVIRNDEILTLAIEFYRILADNTHCYMFTDDETSYILVREFGKVGFVRRQRIVWDKVYMGMGYNWRNQVEYIMMFEKGDRKLNDLSQSNIMRYARIMNCYPSEKPLGIYTKLIRNSTKEGELVLDPCCGASANIARACIQLNRRYIGIEQKLSYFDIAKRTEKKLLVELGSH